MLDIFEEERKEQSISLVAIPSWLRALSWPLPKRSMSLPYETKCKSLLYVCPINCLNPCTVFCKKLNSPIDKNAETSVVLPHFDLFLCYILGKCFSDAKRCFLRVQMYNCKDGEKFKKLWHFI